MEEIELLVNDLSIVLKRNPRETLGIALAGESGFDWRYAVLFLTKKGIGQLSRPFDIFRKEDAAFWREVRKRMIFKENDETGITVPYNHIEKHFSTLDRFIHDKKYFLVGEQQYDGGFIPVLFPIDITTARPDERAYLEKIITTAVFIPKESSRKSNNFLNS